MLNHKSEKEIMHLDYAQLRDKNWCVFLYAASIITLQTYCIVTFPGYYNDGSAAAFDEWKK